MRIEPELREIYDFLESLESDLQYDCTEAKANLEKASNRLEKLVWIEEEDEISSYVHDKVSAYKEWEGTYPSWCKNEDWYEDEEE